MQQALRPSALVPLGFVVENAAYDGATTVITVRCVTGSLLSPASADEPPRGKGGGGALLRQPSGALLRRRS